MISSLVSQYYYSIINESELYIQAERLSEKTPFLEMR